MIALKLSQIEISIEVRKQNRILLFFSCGATSFYRIPASSAPYHSGDHSGIPKRDLHFFLEFELNSLHISASGFTFEV